MSPIVVLLLVTAVAVLLDLALIWAWRYRKSRRMPSATSGPPPAPPRWFAAFVDRLGDLFAAARRNLRLGLAWAREDLAASDGDRLRLSLVAACLLLNLSIGYLYADVVMVEGWQLWTWLISSVVAVAALLPGVRPSWRWSQEASIVLGLAVVAAILRFVRLDTIPPTLHGDESLTVDFTLRHVFPPDRGTIFPFRAGLYSQPTLYNYLLWASLRLFGENFVGLRLTSAVAGSLAILLTYFAVVQLSSRRVALLGAAFLTTYHYHVHWSRLGLNNIWDTLWVPAILGFAAWGWANRRLGAAVVSGVALGLSQYFYSGSKIAFLLLAAWVVGRFRTQRDGRRMFAFLTRLLAASAVIAAPIAIFVVRQPGLYFERLNRITFWQPGAGLGYERLSLEFFEAAANQLVRAAAGFTSLTDMSGFYRPDVPLVLGLAAPLFLAGLFLASIRRSYLPVLWVALTALFGGFLLQATPASSHYVTAIPAIAWLIGVALDAIWDHGGPWLSAGLLLAMIATDLWFYFGVYIPGGPPPDRSLPFPTPQPPL